MLLWLLAACIAAALLVSAVVWYGQTQPRRWAHFMVGDPATGSKLFFRSQSCGHCHSVAGTGGKLARDLAYRGDSHANVSHLVSAMWNHAPQMWERLQTEKISYPNFGYQEMAHIFAFLYTAGYVDEPGDELVGRQLVQRKGCIRCHAVRGEGGTAAPDFARLRDVATPIRLTQAMWNHAPAMQAGLRELKLGWPIFEGREMNHVSAFLRRVAGADGTSNDTKLLPADPERGWKVFRQKSCVACHAVRGQGGSYGPPLGPGRKLPLTIVQFAGEMWNHSPEMWQATQARTIQRATFEGQEIADLVAFLSSLRYFEPAGSSLVGQTLFTDRGCGFCHGEQGQGSGRAPRLRGGPEVTTSITLATALWAHGPRMYKRARELGRPWPTLTEDDVGELIAFLNSPFQRGH